MINHQVVELDVGKIYVIICKAFFLPFFRLALNSFENKLLSTHFKSSETLPTSVSLF